MSKAKRNSIEVQGTAIAVVTQGAADFISLTDIARYRNSQEPFAVFNNWMRSRSTIEFLGLWEKLCNPDFKPLEFERFRNEAGSNYFVMTNLIRQGLPAPERLLKLNEIAITQMRTLLADTNLKRLK